MSEAMLTTRTRADGFHMPPGATLVAMDCDHAWIRDCGPAWRWTLPARRV